MGGFTLIDFSGSELTIEDADLSGGSQGSGIFATLLDFGGDRGSISGGTFEFTDSTRSAFRIGGDAFEVSGGTFLDGAGGTDFELFADTNFTLAADLDSLELEGVSLSGDPDAETREFVLDGSLFTIRGDFADGTAFDLDFASASNARVFLRDTGFEGPAAVPTPTAAAAGLSLLLGFAGRRSGRRDG